jgi:hypothetical protein
MKYNKMQSLSTSMKDRALNGGWVVSEHSNYNSFISVVDSKI